jgi:GNAT superfamily N-acetyltransferase
MGQDGPVGTTVRRAGPEEWRLLRDLRLAALREAPEAFGSTFEREASFSDDQWGPWLAPLEWFVADAADRPVGLVGLTEVAGRPGRCEILSMWVAPEARRQGIGAVLIGAAREWAAGRGASVFTLGVADGNERGRRFYERLGFSPTGAREPLHSDPGRCTNEYTLAI